MGTPLSKVYAKFLGHIDDKEWLLVDDDVIEDLMLEYLENATVDFVQCRKNLAFTPPEKCEVRQVLEGQTSQITLTLKEGQKITSIKVTSLLDEHEYEEDSEFVLKGNTIYFKSPIEGEVEIFYIIDGEFEETLEMIEIRILAHGMVLHYLKPKIMNLDSLKQFVSDKDFTKLSGANMLLRLMGLEKSQLKQLDVLQGRYAFMDFKGWN